MNPATVEKYLADVHYPANKEKLVKNAEGKDVATLENEKKGTSRIGYG